MYSYYYYGLEETCIILSLHVIKDVELDS